MDFQTIEVKHALVSLQFLAKLTRISRKKPEKMRKMRKKQKKKICYFVEPGIVEYIGASLVNYTWAGDGRRQPSDLPQIARGTS